MDEVDIENADDLNELEARLYAQIHHEPSGGDCDLSATYKEASPERRVTNSSVINNIPIDRTRIGRYWNDKRNGRTQTKPTLAEVIQSDGKRSAPASIGGKEQPAETVDKSFRPPVQNLSNLRVNPFASGNGPKTKGSSSQTQAKKSVAAKSKRNEPCTTGPFARQITKLSHAVKYDAKKVKAKSAKAKAKKAPIIDGMIELLSSNESETDDVIEVPLPSPKILTIDSSSDEEQPTDDKNNFVKPQTSAVRETPSRCTSPCSVVSDDFIGQNDRSRLLEENDKADDEDLIMLQEDVDSLSEIPVNAPEKVSESFAKPKKTYRVTEDDFRALDVYDSESDIQESVYSKGLKSTKPSVVVRLDNDSSTGEDDVEEIDVQKTKRLSKRRASSSNKCSESFIDSTDSEQENNENNRRNKSREGVNLTRIPFIARGEELKDHISSDKSAVNQRPVNSSDNEFIATLNTLAQARPAQAAETRESESDEEEEETITARAIAENVIRSENSSIPAEPLIVHDEEANDAIPSDSLAELNQAFNQIDSLNKTAATNTNTDTDNSNQSVELVAPLPAKKNKSISKKLENQTADPVYNIVYCEATTLFGGIGWNEEMKKFYNNSWNGERFNVNAICSRMKTTKSLWKIYTDDRFPKYRKYSHQKCMNCCEFGHIRSRCPKPRKPQICYMCGETGHHEPRCPNTVCLRCGEKTRMFTKSCNSCNYQNRLICPICKIRGHSINFCPDKWRRYHSTTKANEYPNSKVEYRRRKYCCICGFHGHLAEHCKNGLRFAEYPLSVSDIRSHQKSYDDISIKTIRSGIGYNLMYKPEEDLSFELAENKTQRHYYGRFLIAVGMGHLLTRKRKIDAPSSSEPVGKQPKPLTEYVVNPFAKAALEKSPSSKPTIQTNTIDNSTNDEPIDVDDETEVIQSSSTQQPIIVDKIVDDAAEEQPCTSKSVFKAPNAAVLSQHMDISECEPSTSTFKTPDAASTSSQIQKGNDALEIIDSDSNYSFSEHFEPKQQESVNPQKAREMEPLPDFIPINDDGDESSDERSVGISKRFVAVDTDDENSNMDSNPLPDIPCEAKIYLTNFHSKFLLSPEGNKFLVEKSKAFDIKASLDWTSVGHILVIFGLRVNQDKFHTELLHKFRDLSDKLNRKQLENSQKVPKKTDVLIRFLREHVNQLLTNLGNVNDLIKRLTYQENQHTKSGWKLAEKTRRQLNMILIGQAGLRNGSKHLDVLLTHLRSLIDECKDEVVPNEVRDEIDSHWKLIFSSHRHEKYTELVDAYNYMSVKNRLHNINIDPRLLGKKMLDTTLTKAQKEKMEKHPETSVQALHTEKQTVPLKLVPNPVAAKNQTRQPKTPILEKKGPKNSPTNSPSVSQTPASKQPDKQQVFAVNSSASSKTSSPLVSQAQKSTQKQKVQQKMAPNSSLVKKINKVNAEWETKCVNLLTEMDDTGKMKKGSPVRDSKAISVFWSREALKYIDQMMEGQLKPSLLEKLSRVQIKSQKGLLSYNDYRAIIQIHNAIKAKQ